MKNYLSRIFILPLLVIGILLLLYYLPPIALNNKISSWFGWSPTEFNGGSLRKVDLLSDLRKNPNPQNEALTATDSSLIKTLDAKNEAIAQTESVYKDTVVPPDSLVTIYDYGDSTHNGMDPFYEALSHCKERPVRIAFIGDSFIEGDILTADLRAMLQKKFGGCGVGLIDITSITSGFRTTVKHTFDRWNTYSYQEPKKFKHKLEGLSQHYFIGHKGSWVEAKCLKSHYGNQWNKTTSLFYLSHKPCYTKLTLNKKDTFLFKSIGSQHLEKAFKNYGGKDIYDAKWEIEHQDSAIFYAMAMDGVNGIILDNISMRGNSGTQLAGIPSKWLSEFNQLRSYDLIIVQFGLNVAAKNQTNFGHYQKSMEKVIRHFHECFPQAGILIVGVGDKARRGESGEMESAEEVKHLNLYQQSMAANCHTGYWSLLDAMKQEGGMVAMVNHQPAQANLDYTHINFRGGKVIAQKLYDALIFGKGHYDRKKAFEKRKKNNEE